MPPRAGRSRRRRPGLTRSLHFSVHDNGDGTSDGTFPAADLARALLKKALEALDQSPPHRRGPPGPGDRPEAAAQHVARPGADGPAGEPPHRPAERQRVAVHHRGDHRRRRADVRRRAGSARHGTSHLGRRSRRLACKAGLIPMVLDGDSVPLDLGRKQRLFDRYQKIAINHRYRGCAADNCDRPPAWMEFHHEQPWHPTGSTDANNGISLCPAHHRMADHPTPTTCDGSQRKGPVLRRTCGGDRRTTCVQGRDRSARAQRKRRRRSSTSVESIRRRAWRAGR